MDVFKEPIENTISKLGLGSLEQVGGMEKKLSFVNENVDSIYDVMQLFNQKFGRKVITPELMLNRTDDILKMYRCNKMGKEGSLDRLLKQIGSLLKEPLPEKKNVLDYTDSFITLANADQNIKGIIGGLEERGMKPTLYRTKYITESDYNRMVLWLPDQDSVLSKTSNVIKFAQNQDIYFSFIDGILSRGFEFSDYQKSNMFSFVNGMNKLIKHQEKIFSFLDLMKEYKIKVEPEGMVTPDVIIPLAERTEKLRLFFKEFSKYGVIDPQNLVCCWGKGLRHVKMFEPYLGELVELARQMASSCPGDKRLRLSSIYHYEKEILEEVKGMYEKRTKQQLNQNTP